MAVARPSSSTRAEEFSNIFAKVGSHLGLFCNVLVSAETPRELLPA